MRIIGSIGDLYPLDSGGGVVLDYGDGHPNLMYFEPIEYEGKDEYGSPTKCETYCVPLDKRQVLGDVETKQDVLTLSNYSNQIPWSEISNEPEAQPLRLEHGCPYPPREYTEWWDKHIRDIADCIGQTVDKLREYECSDDPTLRAWFYWSVAAYHGWHELSETYVEKLSDLRKRWSLRFYQARKRGIEVRT